MTLVLTRYKCGPQGILGTLSEASGQVLFDTLEHAYPAESGWAPKLPPGIYNCNKGLHTLEHGAKIETFEVMNVPGHKDILFHVGNFDRDTNGCILLGMGIDETVPMLLHSAIAFSKFVGMLSKDSFTLEVI